MMNIFIDTEAFVSANYFMNENLKRLIELAKEDKIRLITTDLTLHEIRNNILHAVHSAQNDVNKALEVLRKKARVLRNVDDFEAYFSLPKLNPDVTYSGLDRALDNFLLDGKVVTLNSSTADMSVVVSDQADNC